MERASRQARITKESTKNWKYSAPGQTLHISEYGPFMARTSPKTPLPEYKLKLLSPMVLDLSSKRNPVNMRKSKASVASEKSPKNTEQSRSKLDMFKVYPLVDSIFSDLIERHGRLVKGGRRTGNMMNQLRSRYIQQMQRVLLNAVGMGEVENPTRLSNAAYLMHREHFKQQVGWLAATVVGLKVQRLRELMLQMRKPPGKEDRKMLDDYGDDSQPSNALWRLFNKEMPEDQRTDLVNIMENNFASLLDQLDLSEDVSRASVQEPLLELKTQITVENMETSRAKWVQYFANRERTPFEQKLSALHLQRKEALISQKLELKRNKMERRQQLLHHRPLTELYTNPRLTHRMRQVLAERAAHARGQATQTTSCHAHPEASNQKPQTSPKRLRMTDVVLKTMGDRDSCCKCHLLPSCSTDYSANYKKENRSD
ncbi:uncharacterized protein LOC117583257 [Drosophila guanche]|uniref:Uncharacterized protein n=1 Tax=Drosophila guanche TaxID=7266 RepID=A0A3B0JET6_DROGU|nr:uncharacterized protein LOC117583257 [Drosophila guanche]SPP80847.1 Hypothetical predicted protein [Drosophila guanche]